MGSVVLSLDAEIGWGFHHTSRPAGFFRNTRENWTYLRKLFDSYDVPATWATVGHLFLDSCEDRHRNHPAGERCCTESVGDLPAEEIWFAPDLIDEIAGAEADHEIAGHGFTHVHFEHEASSPEMAREEIERCAGAATDRGYDLSSFVFPVNVVAHRGMLADNGFDCYRGVNPIESESLPVRKGRKVASSIAGRPAPPIVEPAIDDHGLVDVPASLYLFNFEGAYRRLVSLTGEDPIVRQAKAGIDRVAGSDGVFHMWLHPHNLRLPAHYERLRTIVEYVDRRRADGVRVETMGDVADRVRREAGGG